MPRSKSMNGSFGAAVPCAIAWPDDDKSANSAPPIAPRIMLLLWILLAGCRSAADSRGSNNSADRVWVSPLRIGRLRERGPRRAWRNDRDSEDAIVDQADPDGRVRTIGRL